MGEDIRFRIDDQVAFYGRASGDMNVSAGLALADARVRRPRPVLAVAGLQLWVAVTVAIVGALTTYLEAMQLEATIMLYNQAATNLEGIRAWWTALPPDSRSIAGTSIGSSSAPSG